MPLCLASRCVFLSAWRLIIEEMPFVRASSGERLVVGICGGISERRELQQCAFVCEVVSCV